MRRLRFHIAVHQRENETRERPYSCVVVFCYFYFFFLNDPFSHFTPKRKNILRLQEHSTKKKIKVKTRTGHEKGDIFKDIMVYKLNKDYLLMTFVFATLMKSL